MNITIISDCYTVCKGYGIVFAHCYPEFVAFDCIRTERAVQHIKNKGIQAGDAVTGVLYILPNNEFISVILFVKGLYLLTK